MHKRKSNKINRRRIFFDIPACKDVKLERIAKKLRVTKSSICKDVMEWFLNQPADVQADVLTFKITSNIGDD